MSQYIKKKKKRIVRTGDNNGWKAGLAFKSADVFFALIFVTLFCSMMSNCLQNSAIKAAGYLLELIVIGYSLYKSAKICPEIFSVEACVVAIIVLLNICFSPNAPRYSLLLKFFGYWCCFGYGYSIAKHKAMPKISDALLYTLTLSPALIVALLDNTDHKEVFFANSNVFVFLGISMALLYMFIKGADRKHDLIAWGILLLYVGVGTSLGVIVAVALSFFILNFNWKNLIYLLVGGIAAFLVIRFVNIPVIVRLRDTFAVWGTITWDDIRSIQDIDVYTLGLRVEHSGTRSDTTSSIWRFTQWLNLLIDYFKTPIHIPFGLGADYAISKTTLPPHNDFVMILTEYGLVVFIFFVRFVIKGLKSIPYKGILYLVLAIYCYHLTENLIDSFPQNSVLYFILGYFIRYSKNKVVSNQKTKHKKE